MARRDLIVACGLIGALGGGLFGYAIGRPYNAYRHSWDFVLALSLCTALSASLLGHFLAKVKGDAHAAGMRATWLSFVFGAFNGVLMTFATSFLHGAPNATEILFVIFIAAIFGGVCAIPFIPAIVAVAISAARVNARKDSVAEAAQRRKILRTAALALALASALIPESRVPLHFHLPLHVTNVAIAIIVALIVSEVSLLRALREAAPQRSMDYGLGGETVTLADADETYRKPVTVHAVIHGDRARALETARVAMRGHLIAVGVAALSMLTQIKRFV